MSARRSSDSQGPGAGHADAAHHAAGRRRTEEKLREAELKYKALFDAVRDAVFLAKPAGKDLRFADCNRSAVAMFKAERDELVNKSPFAFSPPKQLNGRSSRKEGLLKVRRVVAGEPQSFPWRYRRADGTDFDAEVTLGRIELADGPCVQGIVREVAAGDRAREALERWEGDLLHMARLRDAGQMAASLAHELRQPLYAIVNYARGAIQRLRKGTMDPDNCFKALEEIVREAERASDIIEHLRGLVAGRKPRRSRVDLNGLIRGAIEFIEAEARQRQTVVNLELDRELPLVTADPVQVDQVILNLVRNGLDAMEHLPPGQRVLTVRTSQTSRETVEIAVRDQGKGIDPGVLDKVFDAFFTTKAEGLGLGLAICRKIVQAHGGHISVASGPHRGATFHFTLPVRKPAPRRKP